MSYQHKDLAAGRWNQLSFFEQMANIGSDVFRAGKWKDKDENIFWNAVERAMELFDLTLEDKRWKGRLREIARTRETFCDAVFDGKEYNTSFDDLNKYFLIFAKAVQLGK